MFATRLQQTYEPYSIEVPEDDTQFEDWTLTKVEAMSSGDGWLVSGGSTTAFLPALGDHRDLGVPEIGDSFRLYCRGFGYEIDGMTLRGTVVWYRTVEQREEYRRRQLADMKTQDARREVLTRAWRVETYEALSAPMRTRMDRFYTEKRTGEKDMDPGSERYELFILSQSDRLYDHFWTGDPVIDVKAINAWKEKSFDEQVADAIPGFDCEAHSGNTFGCAVMFARARLEGVISF